MSNEAANCLFCKIRDGEIPGTIVFRDERCVAFKDIAPRAPMHTLIIPTEHIGLAKDLGHAEAGYRVVLNCNADAGQTVFHVHAHLLAGRVMGWPPG
ncbi:MAG: HIT domain-containing protein [Deltaproteobacteria bacterium]|nr:HIT domain-containing protein [Deltaproteobacteria bacterium]